MDYDLVVRCNVHVELKHIDANLQSMLKGSDRIFRTQGGPASMSEDFGLSGSGREQHGGSDEAERKGTGESVTDRHEL